MDPRAQQIIDNMRRELSDLTAIFEGQVIVTPPIGEKPPVVPPVPTSGNPYADTPERVKIISDGILYAESTMTAPYLQSRHWRTLWDIADKMNVQLEVVNACLLEGVPAENTAHYPEGITVDLRYLPTDAANIDLINRILASFPVPQTYTESVMDECEVRVSPEIRDRLHLPWIKRIQADPYGNHDNHMHVRFKA